MKMVAAWLACACMACGADTIEVFGRSWTVPVKSDWAVEGEVLRLVEHRGPPPGPRRPIQFALTEVPAYRMATVESDVMALGKSLAIAFAYRDEAHFDYAHISIETGASQPVHNGIFHVYGGDRVRISSEAGPAALRKSGEWHHVKLVHDATAGSVNVAVDGRDVPALSAVDRSLGAGLIGIGSFDETGAFRAVKITVSQ